MTKKQKIIVSTTGIFLVMLILVGLTYAYFLTRIKGNENEKSISVTTANLILEYADIDDIVVGGENVEPGTTWTKKFSATNKGNKKVEYGVALEKVVNTLTRRSDLVYTLNCTSSLGTTCNKVETEHEFPIIGTILITNNIEPEEVQSYELIVSYKEMNEDQSVDMNKKIYAKTNIVDPKTFGALGSGTLASALVESAKTATASNDQIRTIYKEVPLTSPGNEISITKYKTENESGIEFNTEEEFSIEEQYQNYYWTYATGYSVDETTGKMSLNSPTVSEKQYNSMYNELVGKYIASSTIPNNCKESQIIAENTKNLINIYKITSATDSKLTVKRIIPTAISQEKTLSLSEDDYGLSYYFRGGIVDNYVNFAGMCWRIVRIQGDGSIKVVLEDKNTTCESNQYTGNWNYSKVNFGYDYTNGKDRIPAFLNPITEKETALATKAEEFQSELDKKIKQTYGENESNSSKLKAGDWCLTEKIYNSYYTTAGLRLWKDDTRYASNICDGTKLTNFYDNKDMYVGTLTADEIVFSGTIVISNDSIHNVYNTSHYLFNDYMLELENKSSFKYYTLTYSSKLVYYRVFTVAVPGFIVPQMANFGEIDFRPAIILSSDTQLLSGNGLKTNPYEIK